MEETIDWQAMALQFQIENEMLRHSLGILTEVHDVVYTIPAALQKLWLKVSKDKASMVMALVAIYWIVSIFLMLYDRLAPRLRGGGHE